MTKIVLPASKLAKNQKLASDWKKIKYYDSDHKMQVTVRYDDECNNGHNTFAITAEIATLRGRIVAGGCLHDEIRKHFPDLARFIKWHLVSSDGPMHYFPNTLYMAGERDHWGLLKGEKGVKKNKDGLPMFEEDGETPIYTRIIGDGKARDFDAARRAAVWPDATDEQLSLPGEELKQLLIERLPALMQEFKKDMEELGFTY